MAEEIIIDAENAVLGRLASYAAKQALQGREIMILNSEKAIILGNKKDIIERYTQRRARGKGSQKGPYISHNPEKIIKRAIRGMLSYKQGRGREALKRIRCFCSSPEKFKDKKIIKAGRGKKGFALEELSKMLAGK